MHDIYQLTSFRLPKRLLERARRTSFDRQLKGGVTRLVCDALESHLDALEKIPLSFEATWLRETARESTTPERVACYGGRYRAQKRVGDPMYSPFDWFTDSELRGHYANGQWDTRTARLVYLQQRTWLKRGEEVVTMPMTPPGWDHWQLLLEASTLPPEGEHDTFHLGHEDIT